MQRNIFTYILRFSARQQFVILLLTLSALPFYYASLDLPKRIINQAIDADPGSFPKALTVFGKAVATLTHLEWLVLLCGIFLVLVFINGAFKYVINVYKGLVGERMLRRLRYQLFERILRFPLSRFRRISSGELVPVISSEVEPLGGFIGDAYSLPLYQGGLLATSLGFIFAQDVVMGLAVIALYPVQIAIIPRLQTQVNQLNKQRVQKIRRMSSRITETVDLVREIRLNRTTRYELAGFSGALGRMFDIRYRIFRKKFFVKFLNNFLLQVTPFLFFLLGGYLVIRKDMSLGELVAVIAAYKEMTPPWRELLGYYQDQQDASVRYEQIVAQFDVPGLAPETDGDPAWEKLPPLEPGQLTLADVSCIEDGEYTLRNLSLTVAGGEHVAVVGDEGSGKDALAGVIAGEVQPDRGTVAIGGRALQDMPVGALARYLSIVDGEPRFRSGTLLDNLIYGLKRFPAADPGRRSASRDRASLEAVMAGNSGEDPEADWIELSSLGIGTSGELHAAAVNALEAAGLGEALIGFGLRARIDPEKDPELAAAVLTMRRWLATRTAELGMSSSIEPFDEHVFNNSLTLGENLLFGAVTGGALDPHRLAASRHIRRLLKRFDLQDELLTLGHAVARGVAARSVAEVPDEHISRELPVDREDIARLKLIAGLAEAKGPGKLSRKDRRLLESVALETVPAKHAEPAIDEGLKNRVVAARRDLHKSPPALLARSVRFFEKQRFIPELTLRENIIFGEPVPDDPEAANRVNAAIRAAIEACGTRAMLVEAALQFHVGTGASALDAAERQQLAIARALIKQPYLLVLNGATTRLDSTVERQILTNLRAAQEGRQLVCLFSDRHPARLFEQVVSLKSGSVEAEPPHTNVQAG